MSTFNPSKSLFLMMLILGTMISISSNSWPATWMGLEINLLAFIPLMSSKDNMMSTEAAMKYFIIQAMASSMLLTFVMLDNIFLMMLNKNMINSAISITLFLKMGAAPFHMWFPSVMEGLSWFNCFILMTWQKLAPFIILSYLSYYQPIMLFVVISSIIIGSIGGLNQTSTRKIMTYSSINHIGWMLLGLMMSENLWQLYFIIYIILSASILMTFHNMSSQHHNQIPFTWNSSMIKFFTSINLMSLGGLPPFLGFLPKWMIIQNSCYNEMMFTMLIMILCSLITLFYYLRLMMSSFLINVNQLKWNQQSNQKLHNILFYYVMSLFCYIVLVIFVLVGVAFLTLLERKVLGYIQIRKGPNKVGMMGIPQPFADAIKLFCSEQTYPMMSNYLMYFLCPVISLFLSLLVWLIYPLGYELISFDLALLFFFCCTSMGVYSMMLAGWSSNSNYALLGGLRAVAQTISYEVSMALILLSFIILVGGFGINLFFIHQLYIWFFFVNIPLFFCWYSSCLAETNRTPFDFSEGESELVSGFNVEYSSGGFALIFMAEYSSILFMSMLTVLIFFGGDLFSLLFYFMLVFMSFVFIWIRGTLPRFRYDKLMYLAWSTYLPVSLNYLVFFCCFSFWMNNMVYWDILSN